MNKLADPATPESDLARQLHRFTATAELMQVFLKASGSECNVFPGAIEADKTEISASWETTFDRGDDYIFVWSKAIFNGLASGGKSHGEEREKLFSFAQVFGLLYKCQVKDFPDEVLKRFASRNGLYNAWPYHREFIQSMMSRMGIPPLLLPLLKPASSQEKKNS